jgi:hypothetical protein
MVSVSLLFHSNKPFKPHSSCTAAMLSAAERLAGCMMYIKEVMYIIQSQQVQHNRHALLLTPQVTSAIPSLSYTAKRTAAADHRPACLCGTCGAPSLALMLHAAPNVGGRRITQ